MNSDQAGSNHRLPGFQDAGDEAVEDLVAQVRRDNAEGERDQGGGLGARVVAGVSGVEEVPVDRIPHPVRRDVPPAGIVRIPGNPGEFFPLLQDFHHEAGGEQGTGGLSLRVLGMDQILRFWRHAPVPVDVPCDQPVVHHLEHVVDPSPDGGIGAGDRCRVPVVQVEPVRNKRQAGGPCHVVIIEAPVGWGHIGNAAIRKLGLPDVIHPLAVKGGDIEEIHLAGRTGGAVPEPPHALVPLRTVHRHASVVAKDATPGGMEDAVHGFIRAPEFPFDPHIVMHEAGGQLDRLCRAKFLPHLDITEAVQRKSWFIVQRTASEVDRVAAECGAQVVGKKRVRIIQ